MRALTSHQCGQGLISILCLMCGLTVLLLFILVHGVFSLDALVFSPPQKQSSKFQFDLKSILNECSAPNTLTLKTKFLVSQEVTVIESISKGVDGSLSLLYRLFFCLPCMINFPA